MPPKRKAARRVLPQNETIDFPEPARFKITDVMEPDEENDRYIDESDLLDVEDVMVEPTPLEKRLRENGRYNQGDWSSEELKKLYDGITAFGTSSKALEYITDLIGTRTSEELNAKVEEIRDMVNEHRIERLSAEVTKWTTMGYRNVQPPAKLQLTDKNGRPVVGWTSAASRVEKQRRGVELSIMHTILGKQFKNVQPSGTQEYKITDSPLASYSGSNVDIDWTRLSSLVSTLVSGRTKVPSISASEAATLLSMLDDIEKEANTLSDQDKAIIKGLMSNIQMNDLRDFEPDIPCSELTATHIIIDPLRTRYNGVSDEGAFPTPEWIDEALATSDRAELCVKTTRRKSQRIPSDDLSRTETPQPTIELPEN